MELSRSLKQTQRSNPRSEVEKSGESEAKIQRQEKVFSPIKGKLAPIEVGCDVGKRTVGAEEDLYGFYRALGIGVDSTSSMIKSRTARWLEICAPARTADRGPNGS